MVTVAAREVMNALSRWTGVIALALAVIIGGTYLYQADKRNDLEACQAQYNKAFTQSLSARSNAANARQDAVDSLLTGVAALILNPTEDPVEQERRGVAFTNLFQSYTETVRVNDETRAANPLPEIPNCR